MFVSEQQRKEYLDHALDLNPLEEDKIAEYAAWLPSNVIDAHAHANLAEHVQEVPPKAFNHMLSTFPSFSIEESMQVNGILHPETTIRSIRFAKTFRGIAHRAANEYLLENSPSGDRVALFGLPEDIPYTNNMLADPRVAGLKMYYSYLEPTASHIYEVFKPEILTVAEENEVPIILHVPKVITQSVGEVLQLKRDFPHLKVSIAHLGSSKFDIPGLQDAYDALAENTDVIMDTSLNPSEEVCSRAIATFGFKRIMYGSDQPLDLLRSVPYVHPERGQRITTSHYYHWQDPDEYAEYNYLADGAVHSHWLCLDALKKAIERLPEADQLKAKQSIFHDNAATFFGFSPLTEVN